MRSGQDNVGPVLPRSQLTRPLTAGAETAPLHPENTVPAAEAEALVAVEQVEALTLERDLARADAAATAEVARAMSRVSEQRADRLRRERDQLRYGLDEVRRERDELLASLRIRIASRVLRVLRRRLARVRRTTRLPPA